MPVLRALADGTRLIQLSSIISVLYCLILLSIIETFCVFLIFKQPDDYGSAYNITDAAGICAHAEGI